MKIIILAAGQGTRLRPLTDNCPKCMVEVKGTSLIERQMASIKACGIKEEDIYILIGYKGDVLKTALNGTNIHFIENQDYETTNMVCTLMCARELLMKEEDIIISYGDIIYSPDVLKKLLNSEKESSVVVDNGWFTYWSARCDNPLEDAETLIIDKDKNLLEIGQKTDDINKVQSQYIGLMRFRKKGLKAMLHLCDEAKKRSKEGQGLWRTERSYERMYMTDLLQGLIDEGEKLSVVEINRGWYEVDCKEDLELAEKEIR